MMQSLQTIATVANRLPSLFFVVPLWIIGFSAFNGVFDDGDPKWDYLWDDSANFLKNPHMSLSPANLWWAFSDGEILGVYEPVSLTIKQMIHSVIDFDARRYRIFSLFVHLVNIYLVLAVARSFLASVNDYEFYSKKVTLLMTQKESQIESCNNQNQEETLATAFRDNPGLRNRKKKKSEGKEYKLSKEEVMESKVWLGHAQNILEYLSMHQALGTIGCCFGTAIFAVHPLQAQTIGWISCMSYLFSCCFALISFNSYVSHRTAVRSVRRQARCTYDMEYKNNKAFVGRTARRKKERKQITSVSEETQLTTHDKLVSLIFYVLATFCKSPAVTLPLVFVIIDVFVYSSPLSVHPSARKTVLEPLHLIESKEENSTWTSIFFPFRTLQLDAFPKLCRLTIRAVRHSAVFFVAAFLSIVLLVRGNSKNIDVVLTPWEKICKSMWALGWYIWKFFMPTNLVAAVEVEGRFNVFEHWEIALSLVVFPYMTVVILANSLKSTPARLLAAAWGVFVALLLPSLGLIQHGRLFLAADRYMYIPMVMMSPLFGATMSGWTTIIASNSETLEECRFVYAGGAVPGLVTSKNANSKDIDQFDALALYEKIDKDGLGYDRTTRHKQRDDVKGTKESCEVAYSTGVHLRASSMLLFAIGVVVTGVYLFVVQITPSALYCWRNSELLWEKNLEVIPFSENAHTNLLNVYLTGEKDLDKALFHAKSAVALQPDKFKYKSNLAIVYSRRNDLIEAETLLKELALVPQKSRLPVHITLGDVYRRMGQYEKSQKEFEVALSRNELNARAHLNYIVKARRDPKDEAKQREWWLSFQMEEGTNR